MVDWFLMDEAKVQTKHARISIYSDDSGTIVRIERNPIYPGTKPFDLQCIATENRQQKVRVFVDSQ